MLCDAAITARASTHMMGELSNACCFGIARAKSAVLRTSVRRDTACPSERHRQSVPGDLKSKAWNVGFFWQESSKYFCCSGEKDGRFDVYAMADFVVFIVQWNTVPFTGIQNTHVLVGQNTQCSYYCYYCCGRARRFVSVAVIVTVVGTIIIIITLNARRLEHLHRK